jgi:hypothetical protein
MIGLFQKLLPVERGSFTPIDIIGHTQKSGIDAFYIIFPYIQESAAGRKCIQRVPPNLGADYQQQKRQVRAGADPALRWLSGAVSLLNAACGLAIPHGATVR